MEEIIINYPVIWENEYRLKGLVSEWIDEFPKMFDDYLNWFTLKNSLSTRPGTLDLFAQYALMYLLRKDYGIHSLTWYALCLKNQNYVNRDQCQGYWSIMKKYMGDDNFVKLRSSIQKAIIIKDPFTGEPDLFCWNLKADLWFFAEAKRRSEPIGKHQHKWFQICENITGEKVKIYRLEAKLPT
jgi:hypothetical protein